MDRAASTEQDIRRARLDARQDAVERELAIAEQLASGRRLPEAMAVLSEQGHRLVVEVGGRRLIGRISHVGDDVVTVLLTGGGTVLVVTDAVLVVHSHPDRESSVVRAGCGYPVTLTAMLRGAVVDGSRVTLGRREGEALRGRIEAVAGHHVQGIEGSGARWLVPLSGIAWIAQSPSE